MINVIQRRLSRRDIVVLKPLASCIFVATKGFGVFKLVDGLQPSVEVERTICPSW